MEVFSDNTIKMGTFNQEAIIISGSRTGMGTALPQAELHISGANNDSLFRIQSPASASIMFVTGSGLVGIGTATPTQKLSVDNGNVGFTSGFGISWDSDTEWIKRAAASDQLQFATGNTVRLNIGNTQGQLVTIGLGATTGTAQFQVRGGGATAASTAMRIEDSGGNARLTILDNGTSAFNTSHLYVSSSGRVGIGTTSPSANLHISGASADSLLRVSSPSATNALFVSGSGNVGIGTTSPSNTLQVVGGITATSITSSTANIGFAGSSALNVGQTIIRGSSINTAGVLIVQNQSGTGTFTVSNEGAITSSTATIGFGTGTALNAGQTTIRGSGLDTVGALTIQNDGGTGTFTVLNGGTTGIGTTSPSARLHVKGSGATSATTALRVENSNATARLTILDDGTSAFNTSHLYVSGSGRVGVGTTTPTNTLQVVGGITATSFTGSLLGTASVAVNAQTASFLPIGTYNITSSQAITARTASFITSTTTNAFIQNGNSFGATALLGTNDNQNLQFETSGSVRMTISSSGNVGIGMTTPAFRLDVSGSARFGTGSVGFASGLGQIHAVDRTGAYITATQTTSSIVTFMGADGTETGMVGTYSNHDFVIRRANSDVIILQRLGFYPNVGIQIAPSDFIHLYSLPEEGNYIRIDAPQVSNNPPLNGGTAKTGYGIVANGYYLAEPDYWMEIKLNEVIVLIPCYTPEV
jgi:hypothetical protein